MALTNSTGSIQRASGLVKKVNIPKSMIPLSNIFAHLLHFLVALALLLAFVLFYRIRITPLILLLPMIVLLQTVLIIGASLITSSLNVFYRDIEYVMSLLLLCGFYLTPIFYPLSYIPKKYQNLYLLNPMAGLVQMYRCILIKGALPDAKIPLMVITISVFLLLGGSFLFKHLQAYFDDYL
jgi:ABC-type polysaccharide/polyol phosphate export permease